MRHNLCINPALANNNTGWGGNGTTPARTAVTGFQRPFAARYVDGSFIRTPVGAVAQGTVYTLSVDFRATSDVPSGHIYIEWQRSDTSAIQYTTASYSAVGGVVQRISVTDTSPVDGTLANAAIIIDGPTFAANTVDVTAVLIEQAATSGGYFDGDSPGGSWDGTAGNSPSTLVDVAPRLSTWVVNDPDHAYRMRLRPENWTIIAPSIDVSNSDGSFICQDLSGVVTPVAYGGTTGRVLYGGTAAICGR